MKNEQELYRCLGGPENLMAYEDFDDRATYKKASKLLLGHNRMATVGAVTEDNAHPFYADHLTGAHNGTLSDENFKRLDDHKSYEVDSECLYNNIANKGLDTLKSLTEGLHTGAWALTYYDSEEKTINFIRNEHRPLWYAFNEKGDTIFWASEAWMINIACARNGVKLKGIKELPVNKHFSLSLKTYKVEEEEFVEGGMFQGKKRVVAGTNYPSYYTNSKVSQKNTTQSVFSNSKKVSVSTSEKEKLRKLKGTEIEFSIDNKVNQVGKRADYYRGTLLHADFDRDLEVRIFLIGTEHEDKFTKVQLYSRFFKGVVKGYRNKVGHGEYLLINVASMKESVEDNVLPFEPSNKKEEEGGEGEEKKKQQSTQAS